MFDRHFSPLTIFLAFLIGWCGYEAIARACTGPPPPDDDDWGGTSSSTGVVIDGASSSVSTTSAGSGGAGGSGGEGTGLIITASSSTVSSTSASGVGGGTSSAGGSSGVGGTGSGAGGPGGGAGVGGGGTGGAVSSGSGTGGGYGGPDCFLHQTCGFGITQIYPIPTTPTTCSTCQEYGEQTIDVHAMVYIAEFMTNCQADCPELSKLTLEFKAYCETLASKGNEAFSLKHTMTYVEDNPQLGGNRFALEFLLDFIDDTKLTVSNTPEFDPDGAKCQVTGTATLELSDGTLVESDCSERTLGFVPPLPLSGGPMFSFEVDDSEGPAMGWTPPDGWDPSLNGVTSYAAPGQQSRNIVTFTNHHPTESMTIQLDVVTENANGSPVVTPGSSMLVDTWELSAIGEDTGITGDAFAVVMNPLPEEVEPTACIVPPTDPANSDQQTDVYSDAPITVQPGEKIYIEQKFRPWNLCACGTKSKWTTTLQVQVEGAETMEYDLSGNFIVDLETPPTNCPPPDPNDCPAAHPGPYTCVDEGCSSGSKPCGNGDGPPCGGGIGSLSGKLPDHIASGLAEKGNHQVAERDSVRPTDSHRDHVGAIFTLTEDVRLHVSKPLSELVDLTTSSHKHRSRHFSPQVMRIAEYFSLSDSPAAGESFSVKTPISILQELGGEVQVLAKFAAGDKQKPAGTMPHSFVTVVRTQLDSNPAMQLELMVQVTAWARDATSDRYKPVTLNSPSITPSTGGSDIEFAVEVPSFSANGYQFAYDVRTYRWNDYEQDCEDKTDNDTDGFTDCDDPDCANHPLCYPGDGGADGAGGSSVPGADSSEASCSCRVIGVPSALKPFAATALFGCVLLLRIRRRRRTRT